jgi:putative PIN family toxin of toxin-antitoxin system
MKVVFDTNILVSAARKSTAARRALDATALARWRIYASVAILDELERVLLTYLQLPKSAVASYRRALEIEMKQVDLPPSRHVVVGDPDDTPVLRTAIAAGADYLVSNDNHLLSLDPYEGIRIVSLASYYQLLERNGAI